MIKIYALMEDQLVLYVGKTTTDLKERERSHRSKSNATQSRYIPKHCKWEIVEIGEYPDDEGTLWEQFWYDTLDPLYNIQRPGQTTAEYEQSEKRKKLNAEYQQTEKYKKSQAKYKLSENGKKNNVEYQRKYQQTEKYKKLNAEASRRYYLKTKALKEQQLAE